MGDYGPTDPDDPEHVGFELVFDLFHTAIFKSACQTEAGIVHHNVEAAFFIQDVLDSPVYGSGIADIHGNGDEGRLAGVFF